MQSLFSLRRSLPAASILLLTLSSAALCQDPKLSVLGSFRAGPFNQGAAEIVAHDPASQRLFVVNGADKTIDIIDIKDPAKPNRIAQIAIPMEHGVSANSVAVRNGIVAVAAEALVRTDPGSCVFFDTDGNFLNAVKAGSLPDMLTFTPDGKKVLVANEGEPNIDYSVDPEGSISIIDISGGIEGLTQANVRQVTFGSFTRDSLEPGIRIFGPGASVAQDLEPEYIAISPDSKTAYVTLQENNAIAIVDVETATVTRIAALGTKDHSIRGNEIDASDRDGSAQFRTWNVRGMYQPDAIVTYTGADGQLFVITANEGDAREYGTAYVEAARVASVRLDPTAYPNAAELQAATALGRLNISTASGDTDGDGDFDQLYAFGARSFTVWTPDLRPWWDSHNQLEVFSAADRLEAFNVSNSDNTADSRSDDKGPEPEALAIGTVRGKNYLFVGNERTSNIMIYDLADPGAPRYTGQVWNRRVNVDVTSPEAGDLGPEGITFVAAENSPNGKPLLIVANEISGTTTIWQID
jgi:2',3'-cyclic-nucleotide 2'-phosphodiesterase/3'-nucleotidase/5'-nucleotidase